MDTYLDSKGAKRGLTAAGIVIAALVLPVGVWAVVVKGPPLSLPVNALLASVTERIGLTGQVAVTSRIIEDPDFHAPAMLELTINFGGVRGVGLSTRSVFVSEAQTIVRRPLLPFDEIEAVFPSAPGSDLGRAFVSKAVISVAYNQASGLLLSTRVVSMPPAVAFLP